MHGPCLIYDIVVGMISSLCCHHYHHHYHHHYVISITTIHAAHFSVNGELLFAVLASAQGPLVHQRGPWVCRCLCSFNRSRNMYCCNGDDIMMVIMMVIAMMITTTT